MSLFENAPPAEASEPSEARLKPPRFSLWTLMIVVTGVAVVCAVFAGVSGHSAIWITIFLLAIGAHVAGNALGTRLRQLGSQRAQEGILPPVHATTPLKEDQFAPASQLSQRTSLGWSIVVVSVFGAIAGGVGGGLGFHYIYGHELTLVNLVLGVFGAGAMGGFLTFWCSSLVRVLWAAWRQAAEL